MAARALRSLRASSQALVLFVGFGAALGAAQDRPGERQVVSGTVLLSATRTITEFADALAAAAIPAGLVYSRETNIGTARLPAAMPGEPAPLSRVLAVFQEHHRLYIAHVSDGVVRVRLRQVAVCHEALRLTIEPGRYTGSIYGLTLRIKTSALGDPDATTMSIPPPLGSGFSRPGDHLNLPEAALDVPPGTSLEAALDSVVGLSPGTGWEMEEVVTNPTTSTCQLRARLSAPGTVWAYGIVASRTIREQ